MHPSSPTLEGALERRLAGIGGLDVRRGEPLANHTSMGVGGTADWFVEVGRRSALWPCLEAFREAGVAVLMLGGGSNTLFTEAGFRGAVLHLGGEFKSIEIGTEPHTVHAGAAATLSGIMKFAQRQGLGGLEFAVGIPGTLGGALAGNAGAGGEDVCTLTESVETLDPAGTLRTLRRGEFTYSYRDSTLRGMVLLGATLKLLPDSPDNIKARIERHLSKRWEQPVGERSSGCMFKNPAGDYAGRLIDLAGLKGVRVGGVRVSEKHANFMVNDGTARTGDIEALMALVRGRVQEQTGIDLEPEVRMISPFP